MLSILTESQRLLLECYRRTSNSRFPVCPWAEHTTFWVPLALTQKEQTLIGNYNYIVVARLKRGVTMAQAQADVRATAQRIYESIPAFARAGITLDAQVSLVSERVAQNSRKLLWLLMGAVGFVLLIACVNVANLLLGRAAGRERELTIRSSLGASSTRLLRQLFTESLVLSISGGAAGLMLAAWLVTLLESTIPVSVPRASTIDIDWRVVGFTGVVSVLTGVLFGMMPALRAARAGEAARLRSASRSTTSGLGRVRFRGVLVASEVALSLVLLVGAGLLVRSLVALRAVDPGFDVQHVLTARVTLPETAYPDEASVRSFFKRAVNKIRNTAGRCRSRGRYRALLTLRNQRLFTVRIHLCRQPSLSMQRYWEITFKRSASASGAADCSIRAIAADRNQCWSSMKQWLASTFLVGTLSDNK